MASTEAREADLPEALMQFIEEWKTKPGKYNIQVCMGTACYVKGGEDIIGELEEVLGIGVNCVTEDGLFSIESVRCVGCCGLAPVFVVGDEVFGKVKKDDVAEIIARFGKRAELSNRKPENDEVRITVGMGTCGIAAGSMETYQAFKEAFGQQPKYNIILQQSGSTGLCHSEPTVEVSVPGMPGVIYGNVDRETAKKIMNKHIYRRILLNHHIYDRPSPDIVEDLRG
jgi:NADH:ubiquinone oxidoreductase subunit E